MSDSDIMVSDDDCRGRQLETARKRKPHAKRPRSATPATTTGISSRSKAMDDAASSSQCDSDEGGGEILCHLCLKPVSGGGSVKVFKGLSFHTSLCFAVVRCFRRMLKDQQPKLAAADQQMAADPASWRKDVLPLVVQPGAHRTENIRAIVRSRRTTDERFREQSRVCDELVLTRTRFKAYMQFWENMGSPQADARFDRLLEEQGPDPSGIECVRIPDNERRRSITGSSRRQQTVTDEIFDDGEPDDLDGDGRLSSGVVSGQGGIVFRSCGAHGRIHSIGFDNSLWAKLMGSSGRFLCRCSP